MITTITRNAIFHSSVFADNFIAEMQQAYAVDFDSSVKEEAAHLKKSFDHLQPFKPIDKPINQNAVLAFNAKSKKDYIKNFPIQLIHFFNCLAIEQVYLLQFTKMNLVKDFPFQNFTKKDKFKKLAANGGDRHGYLLNTSVLAKVFPLFFFSGLYDSPVIFLLTAIGSIPVSVRLCDDGNLHLNFQKRYDGVIRGAAIEAGFITGDLEICNLYSVNYLDKIV